MTIFSNFGKLKHKQTPRELVTKTHTALHSLTSWLSDRDLEKIRKDATICLAAVKQNLLGLDNASPDPAIMDETMACLLKTDIIFTMIQHLKLLDFETRKDAVALFTAVTKYHRVVDPPTSSESQPSVEHHGDESHELRCDTEEYPGLLYLKENFRIVLLLFELYEVSPIALNCGSMLRDCFRSKEISRRFMSEGELMHQFFERVQVSSFEVASDAFNSFKILLQRHSSVVSVFLQEHYDAFFQDYNELLKSQNYVTRRQSLKLLGELLLHQTNVRVMVMYVSDVRNLMLVMNLLKDSSRTIQFEAFHVFKVFVANPRKPAQVKDILISNQEKLLRYLSNFLEEREVQDEDFALEKADIIREIGSLVRDASDQIHVMKEKIPSAPGDLTTSVSFGSMGQDSNTAELEARAMRSTA